MPIRITGMNSGLDTESIVSALVMNYQTKVDKQKKAQTKLSWKQDAWKSVNTQVNSLFTSVGKLRFSSAYATKKATASDSTKAKVTADSSAVNGSQNLKIKQLAATGYVTGAKLNSGTTASTKLKDLLGSDTIDSGKITVKTASGETDIDVDGNTSVNDFVSKLKNAGVNASFDSANGRIFVSAKNSGAANDFSLTAANADGLKALSAFGVNVESSAGTAQYADLAKLATVDEAHSYTRTIYSYDDAIGTEDYVGKTFGQYFEDYGLDEDTVLYKQLSDGTYEEVSSTDTIEEGETYYNRTYAGEETVNVPSGYNAEATRTNVKNALTALSEAYAKKAEATADNETLNQKLEYAQAYQTVYSEISDTSGHLGQAAEIKSLYEKYATDSERNNTFITDDGAKYDSREEVKDEDGNVTGYKYSYTDENGEKQTTDVMSEKILSVNERIDALAKEIGLISETSEEVTTENEDGTTSTETKTSTDRSKLDAYLNAVTTLNKYEKDDTMASVVSDVQANGNDIANFISDTKQTIADNKAAITAAEATIKDNATFDKGSAMGAYSEDDINKLAAEWEARISMAYGITSGTVSAGYSEGAARVNGQDAEIELNNASFTSTTNTFNINGLSIEALAKTDDDGITVTTSADTQGLYDKIKGFLSEYNDVINSLMKQYNADSAKGYEPLTDDEKAEMTDKQIEQWEEKIKNSLLRRDGNMNTIIQSMASAMYSSFEINGKNYSLASFGIQTLGLGSKQNENYAYHIDGDEDDSYTSTNADKLMKALNEDPDTVVEFMKKLTSKLYSNLDGQMKSSSLRSASTIYNDKEMATEYSDYTKTIKNWQQKLEDAESKYFKQFTAMEKALAQLNQNSSALSGLLGG